MSLRRLNMADAEWVYAAWQANARWHCIPIETMSYDEWVAQMFLPGQWFELEPHLAVINLCNFNWLARRAEMSVLALEHGNGLAACKAICHYAFETLGLNSIWSTVMADNEPMNRLLSKAGIEPDGTMRQARYINGRFIDLRIYSILVSDGGWR